MTASRPTGFNNGKRGEESSQHRRISGSYRRRPNVAAAVLWGLMSHPGIDRHSLLEKRSSEEPQWASIVEGN
jgi:hypothetical protein